MYKIVVVFLSLLLKCLNLLDEIPLFDYLFESLLVFINFVRNIAQRHLLMASDYFRLILYQIYDQYCYSSKLILNIKPLKSPLIEISMCK